MEKWEQAAQSFLSRFENEKYFAGAVLSGSYAVGNYDEFSDIDIFIVTDDSQDWRERGNLRIDGFLIEYFINPVRQIKRYLEEEFALRQLCTANILAAGKILCDKNGEVLRLKNLAQTYLEKDFSAALSMPLSLKCYYLWDDLDSLKSAVERGANINLLYYLALERLIKTYFEITGVADIPFGKLERILFDSGFAQKYGIKKLPAPEFCRLLHRCLNCGDEEKPAAIRQLYDFVINACGGFDIDKFVLRSPAEK